MLKLASTMKIGRNELCFCGSGKKYKKCCIYKVIPIIQPTPTEMEEIRQKQLEFIQQQNQRKSFLNSRGIYIDFVRPTIFQGKKVWALGSTVYHSRPTNETFHEFIIYILYITLGEEWRLNQLTLPEEEQHFIYRCSCRYSEWRLKNAIPANKISENIWGLKPDGWSRALVSLAFDICSLVHAEHLPENLLNRLKNRDQYQGARYEIAVAAIIARLGYKIHFLDEVGIKIAHCEFIAEDIVSGEKIAVEAKSKEREGVLHRKGKAEESKLLWGDIQRLYRHALNQNPKDKPFLIFIDMNSPQTPNLNWEDKPWVKDIKKMVKQTPLHIPNNPDPCSGLIFTNYSYHYQSENEALSGEHLLSIPLYPSFPIKKPEFFTQLQQGLGNYGNVPNLDIEIGV